jgi:hypothetical protein
MLLAIARSDFPGASAKEQTANRTAMAVNGKIADAAAHFGGKAKVVVQAEQRLPHSSDRSAVGAEQLDGLKQGQAAFDRRCVMRQGLKGFAPAVIGARSDTRGQWIRPRADPA